MCALRISAACMSLEAVASRDVEVEVRAKSSSTLHPEATTRNDSVAHTQCDHGKSGYSVPHFQRTFRRAQAPTAGVGCKAAESGGHCSVYSVDIQFISPWSLGPLALRSYKKARLRLTEYQHLPSLDRKSLAPLPNNLKLTLICSVAT